MVSIFNFTLSTMSIWLMISVASLTPSNAMSFMSDYAGGETSNVGPDLQVREILNDYVDTGVNLKNITKTSAFFSDVDVTTHRLKIAQLGNLLGILGNGLSNDGTGGSAANNAGSAPGFSLVPNGFNLPGIFNAGDRFTLDPTSQGINTGYIRGGGLPIVCSLLQLNLQMCQLQSGFNLGINPGDFAKLGNIGNQGSERMELSESTASK